MTYDRAAPDTFEAAREALTRLRAEIDQELASVRERLADMETRDEEVRRINQRASEILSDLARFAPPRS